MSGTKPRSWTETTIESAIDTLANLTSVQGRTVTLADANLDVLFGWDDSAGAYDNFALADITTEGAPADGDFVLIYGAEGDLRKVDWADLPGAGSGIANVVEDTSPELGGDLESNNFDIKMEQFSADAVDAEIIFQKSRNASIGSHTVVQDDDDLGSILFQGSDGTNFETAAMIVAEVDGSPGNNDMPGRLGFYTTPDASTTPVQRMRISQDGTVYLGDGDPVNTLFGFVPTFSMGGEISQADWNNDSNGSSNFMVKSRGGSSGVHAVVQDGDDLGGIWFAGSDGGEFVAAALIFAEVDGTPGDNDMPGRLSFHTTADAGSFPTERLRIHSNGRITAANGAISHFWVYWTANSTTILASYNMTSIADTGVGDADGTIDVDFSSVNWAGFVCTNDATNGWDAEEVQGSGFNARAAGTFGVLCATITDGGTAVTSLTDPEQWQVVGFGVSA